MGKEDDKKDVQLGELFSLPNVNVSYTRPGGIGFIQGIDPLRKILNGFSPYEKPF